MGPLVNEMVLDFLFKLRFKAALVVFGKEIQELRQSIWLLVFSGDFP